MKLSRNLFYLMSVISMAAIVACSGENGTGDTNSGSSTTVSGGSAAKENGNQETPVSLKIEDLEKVDSWDKQARAHGMLTEKMAEVMSGITDRESAEASIEKFRQLASQFAALNRAEDTLGDATAEVKTAVMKIVGPANEKFDAAYTKLKENEELFEMVEEALDKAYVGEEF